MTPAEVWGDALRSGLRLSVNGAKLHVDGHLSKVARDRLVEHKAAILQMLRMRDRLVRLAGAIGVPAEIVAALPARELAAWSDGVVYYADADLQREVLTIYLRTLAENASWGDPPPDGVDDPRQPGEFHDWRDGLTATELQRIRGGHRDD